MEQSFNPKLSYQLWAQHADDKVIIKAVGAEIYIVRKAADVMSDQELVQRMPPAQMAIIGFIAGQCSKKNKD